MEKKINIGDRVKVNAYEGIVMPSNDNDLVLKLDNGYNIGFNKNNVKEIKLLKKINIKKNEIKFFKEKKGLKNIVMLHTGGTITSKVDYETGGVKTLTSAEELLALYPELREMANLKTEKVASIMSEDINFEDYNKISKAIKSNLDVDGIIITHGTDTMCFTSAAMAFVFENLNIPVIFVGSQRSSDRGSSDSGMNLICAVNFIINTDFTGVALCMHNSQSDDKCAILSPTKTRKMHTSRRDAFKSVNDIPIALVDYDSQKIDFLKQYRKKSKENNLVYKNKFSEDVALLKMYPNIKNKLIEFHTKNYKAFILENTGLGHAPTNTKENEENYNLLKTFIKNNGIVGITSQCLYGRVHSNIYSNLRRLLNIGCIFCEDMLPETAYIKLCWLLGNHPEKAKELLNKNLRDEILERTTSEYYVE